MNYELAHDSIAKQVFQKASTEARTRRKVERFIRDRYLAYTERGAKITQDDLDFIAPYLEVVNISSAEDQFIKNAKRDLLRTRRRKRLLTASVIVGLSLLSGLSFMLWRSAVTQQKKAEIQEAAALDAQFLAEEQSKKVEIQKQEIEQQKNDLEQNEERLKSALKTAQDKEREALAAKRNAEKERQNAENSYLVAESMRMAADTARLRAVNSEEEALISRQDAQEQTKRALEARTEAELLAAASQLCAIAISQSEQDRTLALQRAFEACELSGYENELAVATLMRFTNDNSHAYYLSSYKDAVADTVNQSLGLSADGQLAAIGQEDGTVLLLRAKDQSLQHRLKQDGHSMTVRSLQFSRDNKLLLTAADDEKVCLWNTADGSLVRSYRFPETQIKAAVFAPDEQSIFLAGQDGKAWRRTLSNQPLECNIQHKATIWDMAFSPDGQYLATVGYDGYVKLWSKDGLTLVKSARIKNGLLKKLAFSPEGGLLATADLIGRTTIWQAANLKKYRELTEDYANVRALSFSQNGRWLVKASGENLRAVDMLDRLASVQLIGHQGDIFDVVFSPDGETIWSTGADGTSKVWDWRYRQTVQTIDEKIDGGTFDVAYSSDGQWIASGGQDSRVRLWRNDGQALAPAWMSEEQGEHLWAVGFCQQDQQIWSVDEAGQAIVRRKENGRIVSKYTLTGDTLSTMTASADGHWLAIATLGSPHRVSVWDMENQEEEQTFVSNTAEIMQLAFSQDGNWLVSVSVGGEVTIYDWASQQIVLSLQSGAERISALAIHPEQNLLAIGHQEAPLRLYQLTKNADKWSYAALEKGPQVKAISSLAFSKDGQWLFIGDKQEGTKMAYIWSTPQQQLVQSSPLTSNYGSPGRALFHPLDNREIITACLDGTIRVIKNMPYTLLQSE